jgi:predicted Rossmann-fold nucleotide-binding protein
LNIPPLPFITIPPHHLVAKYTTVTTTEKIMSTKEIAKEKTGLLSKAAKTMMGSNGPAEEATTAPTEGKAGKMAQNKGKKAAEAEVIFHSLLDPPTRN